MRRVVIGLAFALGTPALLTACGTASKNIAPLPVAAERHRALDCAQISSEIARIQTLVVAAGGRLDKAVNDETGQAVVGVVLFWPALFGIGVTADLERQLARLKGEYESLQLVAAEKSCPAQPPTPIPTPTTTKG